MPEPLILADPNLLPLPTGQRFFTERITFRMDERFRPVPNFNITETAKVFFGRNYAWLFNHLDTPGRLVIDGEPITGNKDVSSKLRWFSLYDIERIAHSLANWKYGLTGRELTRTVLIVKSIAENYGYI